MILYNLEASHEVDILLFLIGQCKQEVKIEIIFKTKWKTDGN